MGQIYSHLTLNERIELYRLHAAGSTLRGIASALGRSPSTICRELKRNSRSTRVWVGGYGSAQGRELGSKTKAMGLSL